MLLLVGLGNPGQKYAHNRHNAGMMAVDAIADSYRLSAPRQRFQGVTRDGLLAGEKLVCLKPTTFMNLSGQSVGAAMRFFKLTPADVVVFHDELDLAPGKLRVKTGGGNGGHNGLKSIDAHIGLDYRRARIGIGHPGDKDLVTPYVLGDFTTQENQQWLAALLGAIAACAEYLVRGEDDAFQSRVMAMLKPNLHTERPSKDDLT
ncbi:MAG: peptidyl-tRNA hydrolase, PTH1 family [Alphaproteobacteria bacterium]|nr:peptidyl-tRNA hydrolase, PTH1 family [Alphaproteobacteria bacterium]